VIVNIGLVIMKDRLVRKVIISEGSRVGVM
jgi:hypothetical protein